MGAFYVCSSNLCQHPVGGAGLGTAGAAVRPQGNPCGCTGRAGHCAGSVDHRSMCVCQPGLAQGFDLFRLLAINGAALWACGTVLLLRLRSGRRYRTLWTVAALLIAAIGLEVFVGNAPYFATHGYQPVDLRAYLQDAPADGEPIALNDEHSTLPLPASISRCITLRWMALSTSMTATIRRIRTRCLSCGCPVPTKPAPPRARAGSGRRPRERTQPGAHAGFFRRGGYPDPASGGL